jgi:hypothetical protein
VGEWLRPRAAWASLSLLGGAAPGGRVLFVDLETTGLAGGSGTYAFLLGCAWIDDDGLRTRQYFLADFAAERALLDELAGVAAAAGTLVTYNGKAFDVPLLEARYTLHRMPAPFAGLPHVDLLHAARRLWRHAASGSGEPHRRLALSAVERVQLGHPRDGDVPGFEIPSRYFGWLRDGDARALGAVLEHNRHDLLALAALTSRVATLLERGPSATAGPREALGLGRLYARAGLTGRALAAFAWAAGIGRDVGDGGVVGADALTRAEALGAYAALLRRERRFADAADAWRRLVALEECPPLLVREAAEALAVHHEHRLRDLPAARALTLRSLRCAGSPTRRRALEHRLARLERKLGTPPPLFSGTGSDS